MTVMQQVPDLEEIRRRYGNLKVQFPGLRVEERASVECDIHLRVPPQSNLGFEIHLYLTGDELHMTAGEHFWLEWLPAKFPQVVDDYFEAVAGLLSGVYRISERYRWGRIAKAQLQRPEAGQWKTIGTWFSPLIMLPGRSSTRILQRTDRAMGPG